MGNVCQFTVNEKQERHGPTFSINSKVIEMLMKYRVILLQF